MSTPWHCLQDSRETAAADELGLSEDLDGEYRDAAAATRTVQGMPGVMNSQSSTAQVAAEKVQAAQDETKEEQKWKSFMAEHFGESTGKPQQPPVAS